MQVFDSLGISSAATILNIVVISAARSISTELSPSSSTSALCRIAVLLRLSARCSRLEAGARRVQSASAAQSPASSRPSSLGRINSCKAGLVAYGLTT